MDQKQELIKRIKLPETKSDGFASDSICDGDLWVSIGTIHFDDDCELLTDNGCFNSDLIINSLFDEYAEPNLQHMKISLESRLHSKSYLNCTVDICEQPGLLHCLEVSLSDYERRRYAADYGSVGDYVTDDELMKHSLNGIPINIAEIDTYGMCIDNDIQLDYCIGLDNIRCLRMFEVLNGLNDFISTIKLRFPSLVCLYIEKDSYFIMCDYINKIDYQKEGQLYSVYMKVLNTVRHDLDTPLIKNANK